MSRGTPGVTAIIDPKGIIKEYNSRAHLKLAARQILKENDWVALGYDIQFLADQKGYIILCATTLGDFPDPEFAVISKNIKPNFKQMTRLIYVMDKMHDSQKAELREGLAPFYFDEEA